MPIDFASAFTFLGIDPLSLKGLPLAKVKEKVESAFRLKKGTLGSAPDAREELQKIKDSFAYLSEQNFYELEGFIKLVESERKNIPLESDMADKGKIASHIEGKQKAYEHVGNQAFNPSIVRHAYEKFYKAGDKTKVIEEINMWLKGQGITSWKIEAKKEKRNGIDFELPSIVLDDTGYLMDTAEDAIQLSGSRPTSQPRLTGIPHTVNYFSGKHVLRNFMTREEMKGILDDVDAVAQYEVLGDSVDEAVKNKALVVQKYLPQAESESVNMRKLYEAAKEKYAFFKRGTEEPQMVTPEGTPSISAPDATSLSVSAEAKA